MRAYTNLRGTCPECSKTFDLEYRQEGEDTMVKLNRGDAAFLPNPVGWYMPAHRDRQGWAPCFTSLRLVVPGR